MPNIFHNSLSLGYSPSPSYPIDGLVERWDFNDTLTGLNGNTWTMNNSNWTYETESSLNTTKIIKVTEANCRGTISDSFFTAVNTDFSVSVWLQVPLNTKSCCWIGKGTFGNTTSIVININNSAGFGLTSKRGWITTTEITESGGVEALTWKHLVLTFKTSDKSMQMYINAGTPVTGTAANQLTSSSSSWVIFDAGVTNFWSTPGAKIGLMYIYNKVLTATEVSTLYNNGAGV